MAGDEKRPTYCCGRCPEIAGGGFDCTCRGNPRCMADLVSRLRKAYRSLDGVVVVSPRLLAEAADALEAALPGDDDWEYRYAEVYEDETYTYGPGDGLWYETAEGARASRVEDSDVIVRRRKPGPVEILPEPVEEVPRGGTAEV